MSGLVEAELKARVADADRVRDGLEQRAAGVDETYHDTYYDLPGNELTDRDQELRLRTVTNDDGTRSLLTFKTAVVDEASGSRPEYESTVEDPEAVAIALEALGAVELISFRKHCRNHSFTVGSDKILATLVEVPDIDGTFLEVETLAPADDVDRALGMIRSVMHELGIDDSDLTTETYTGAVSAARNGGG